MTHDKGNRDNKKIKKVKFLKVKCYYENTTVEIFLLSRSPS